MNRTGMHAFAAKISRSPLGGGQVKRRMVQMQGAARPGEEFAGGTVVDAARGELLVVAPI